MSGKKTSKKKPATKPAKRAVADDQPVADDPSPTRRPLARNVNIDGVWYGPAWGNADQYPDWPGLRDTLFETD